MSKELMDKEFEKVWKAINEKKPIPETGKIQQTKAQVKNMWKQMYQAGWYECVKTLKLADKLKKANAKNDPMAGIRDMFGGGGPFG